MQRPTPRSPHHHLPKFPNSRTPKVQIPKSPESPERAERGLRAQKGGPKAPARLARRFDLDCATMSLGCALRGGTIRRIASQDR